MSDDKFELLEQQIEKLEKKILGDANKDASYPKVIDTLASLKRQMHTALTDRQKIQPTLKKLGELNDYLDPSFTETLMLNKEAKTDIILSEEDFVRETAAQLEKVKDMTEVLGSEHIKVVPALDQKLQDLTKIHLTQQDKTGEISEDVKGALLQYNNIISLMSKQFVQWDELVTKIEIAAQPKVIDD